LILLAPILGLAWRGRGAGSWERICEPRLLRHILAGAGVKRARWPLAAFALGWVGACVALAGPTWERLPQVSFVDPSRTVFVLGLAPSMEARDVAPSRMARARHKLQDAVEQLGAGSAALVVYREEAFAATPLTDDMRVLRELTPLLETNLAPGRQVLPARGIDEATRLLEPVGLIGAHIVLVTDGTDDAPEATREAASAAARRGARVSVLGIAGDSQHLKEVAAAGHGTFAALTADDRDVNQLLDARDAAFGTSLSKSERQADAWLDMGVWLVWIPLLLAPLAFRKGWATALLALLCLQLPAHSAQAGIGDWFQRQDQRAARDFAQERYEAAAAAFEDPAWRAAAQYRAGDFDAAAAELANRTDPESSYNRGNALAQAGKLEEALAAYDAALAAQPEDPDARFNRDLVKRLLEQQKPPSSGDASNPGDSGHGQAEQSPSRDTNSADSSEAPPNESTENGADAPRDAAPEQSADSAADASPEASANDESSPEQTPGSRESATQEGETSPGPDDETADVAGADTDAQVPPQQADAGENESAPGSEASEAEQGAGARSEPPADLAQQGSQLPPTFGTRGTPASPEERQAARWMARLPDDPGGLLREKIRRDYRRKLTLRRQGDEP